MERKHRGAHSELIACAWLLSQGYEVFRNVSPCGLTDLVTLRDGVLQRFDVKTVAKHRNNLPFLSDAQIKEGVIPLYVYDSGKCVALTNSLPRRREASCARCGVAFVQRKAWQKFCSRECARNVKIAGTYRGRPLQAP